ncbi:MAG: UPF0175 family protein [Leptolyngbyaceae cyanobacterium SM1_4_3]|nr:UPF0175 family protein [Leptolyngbyaceae cyanobacterium SM1_4_3]
MCVLNWRCEAVPLRIIALFQQNRITLGTASQLANLHQIEFQRLIASRGICIHYDVEDLEQDLSSLRQNGW